MDSWVMIWHKLLIDFYGTTLLLPMYIHTQKKKMSPFIQKKKKKIYSINKYLHQCVGCRVIIIYIITWNMMRHKTKWKHKFLQKLKFLRCSFCNDSCNSHETTQILYLISGFIYIWFQIKYILLIRIRILGEKKINSYIHQCYKESMCNCACAAVYLNSNSASEFICSQ